jgi:hypothetical protein
MPTPRLPGPSNLRHTWASWHVQGGTPLSALHELSGWETERMVQRYAHFAAEHLAGWVGNTESHGTTSARCCYGFSATTFPFSHT